MGSSDVPPPGAPAWLVPLSTALLAGGVSLWCATYVLMTRRSLQTRSYGMPLLALATNLSWEVVYAGYVTEMPLELAGFAAWLLLDVGLVYTTVRFAPEDWRRSSPVVGRRMGWILGVMVAVGCAGHYAFARWWLSRPGVGHGDKSGKWWFGREGYDTTELAYWSASIPQVALSAGSVAMLLVRGHSGGTSYPIWLCRMLGSISGLLLCNGALWWYWPEAHGYFVNPFGIFLDLTWLLCDLAYPFLLWKVRQTERALADGRLISGEEYEELCKQGKKEL
ncbi:hypothetical protein NKR23_g4203 [Pleurostoma richardsiae]|uniref:Uncharacterized protein n=1 Tax=Pleurostoma richardsiae TaxID=41990 RepID=A0AA38RRR6_9PEZI|nr:hypothetical protein NKR23_g4203 [Pleurostoma richardsiae]